MEHHDEMVYRCPASQCWFLFMDVKLLRKHVTQNHDFTMNRTLEAECKIDAAPPMSRSGVQRSDITTEGPVEKDVQSQHERNGHVGEDAGDMQAEVRQHRVAREKKNCRDPTAPSTTESRYLEFSVSAAH